MAARIPSPRTIRRAFARKGNKESRQAPRQPTWTQPRNSTSSEAQIDANRENAQLSTGPTSEQRKLAVSQNRRTHGLNCQSETFTVLACEVQADFDALLLTLLEEQNPQDTLEHLLVTSMAQHRWLFQRANRLQESCFDPATGHVAHEKQLALYLRYATTHERAFHKCLADLLKLRKEKRQQQIGFESEQRAIEKHKLSIQALEFDNLIRKQEINLDQLKQSKLDYELFIAEYNAGEIKKNATSRLREPATQEVCCGSCIVAAVELTT